MTARIMVVDDDRSIRETLESHFRDGGYGVSVAASAEEALSRVAVADPSLVITDVRMSGIDGLTLLAKLREARPDTDVIVITAFEDMRTAIEAMKAGALDYLVKPLDLDQIDLAVERCLRDQRSRRRIAPVAESEAESYALSQLVGRDQKMIAIYKTIGCAGADPWRDRHWERSHRARDSLQLAASRGTVRRGELHGGARAIARERAVWTRARRVHGSNWRSQRPVRARGPGDDLPR
jgi:DNA-binding response OmpR family regulator